MSRTGSASATSFVLGTAGHVDHGKTSLVRALTGTETDRLREEKERGLTIDLGFARLDLGESAAGVVDVPGHRDFIGNMLAGSTGVDALLLVVSAAEGPMPQTIEHLQIAHVLGIEHGVVALTHCDVVEPEFADLADEATRDVLADLLPMRNWPVVRVDSISGRGLDELREKIAAMATELPVPPGDPLFRMPVDRSFVIDGTGTVATGTVWSGHVETGDALRVVPGEHTVRVRSLESHGERTARLGPRMRGAAGLVGAPASEVERGTTLVAGQWPSTSRIGVRLRMLPGAARILEHGLRVRVWLGTREVMGRVLLVDRVPIPAGSEGFGVIELEAPLLVRAGDRCVIRFYSPVELLGGAEVAEADPPRRWVERADRWETVLDAPPPIALEAAVDLGGSAGVAIEDLRRRVPSGRWIEPAAAARLLCLGDRLYHARHFQAAREFVLARLAAAHAAAPRRAGVPLQEVRSAAAERRALVEHAVEVLEEDGAVVRDGPSIRLASHAVRLTPDEIAARDRLDAILTQGGLAPPAMKDLPGAVDAPAQLVADLVRIGVENGTCIQVTPDYLISYDAAETLGHVVAEVFADRDLAGPADFRQRLGVTRRHLIPLLEYLDRRGWTRRVEGGRIPGPRFGAPRPQSR